MNTLEIITTGTGTYEEGIRGRIIAGGERVVYLGNPPEKVTLPDFTIELTKDGRTWRQEYAQYGRDFRFTETTPTRKET
jgi:hypothetical protein